MYARCTTQQVWRALVAAAIAFASYVLVKISYILPRRNVDFLPARTQIECCDNIIEMFLTLLILTHTFYFISER